jgi:hypothetical protein
MVIIVHIIASLVMSLLSISSFNYMVVRRHSPPPLIRTAYSQVRFVRHPN